MNWPGVALFQSNIGVAQPGFKPTTVPNRPLESVVMSVGGTTGVRVEIGFPSNIGSPAVAPVNRLPAKM